MQVRELMSTAVEVVGRNDDLSMVEELMTAKKLRHVPVVEDGEVVAIISQRDLFKAMMSSTMGYGEKAQKAYLHNVRVKEVMTYPAITVAPDTSVGAAAELMLQKGIGCLPVVDGTRLVGIVTKTDLLRYLRSLST
ncbi:MAG TPA: CBS domain-containing protein [Candidatus Tectomicrobia bacterium]|jgi:CBS domain-containing protein